MTLAEAKAELGFALRQAGEHKAAGCMECILAKGPRRRRDGPGCDELKAIKADVTRLRADIRAWLDPPDQPQLDLGLEQEMQ